MGVGKTKRKESAFEAFVRLCGYPVLKEAGEAAGAAPVTLAQAFERCRDIWDELSDNDKEQWANIAAQRSDEDWFEARRLKTRAKKYQEALDRTNYNPRKLHLCPNGPGCQRGKCRLSHRAENKVAYEGEDAAGEREWLTRRAKDRVKALTWLHWNHDSSLSRRQWLLNLPWLVASAKKVERAEPEDGEGKWELELSVAEFCLVEGREETTHSVFHAVRPIKDALRKVPFLLVPAELYNETMEAISETGGKGWPWAGPGRAVVAEDFAHAALAFAARKANKDDWEVPLTWSAVGRAEVEEVSKPAAAVTALFRVLGPHIL